MNYYNEFDPKAAAWLRELIKAGLIPAGDVDERSIKEVHATDLLGYTQHHFFCGIGGWSLALRLAGWPDTRPVVTGSCPCQPYSEAGKGLGDADPRNLWPDFYRLIREQRPVVVFGEQVASAIGKGWLDGISTDLEREGYACGAAVLGAHSVGAPHIRQRLYWVADAKSPRRWSDAGPICGSAAAGIRKPQGQDERRAFGETGRACDSSTTGGLVVPFGKHERGDNTGENPVVAGGQTVQCRDGSADADNTGRRCEIGRMEHASGNGWEQRGTKSGERCVVGRCSASPWDDFDILPMRDGKSRRVESGTFPLAHGVSARVGRLRGYGNAIIPQVAAEFIEAYIEIMPDFNLPNHGRP